MTWTAPTTVTVPSQPGVKMYNMTASGTIYMGQGVALSPYMDSYVYVPDISTQRLFGIAAYDAYHNSSIAIWGLGNIVYACISGNQAAGTYLGLNCEGKLAKEVTYPSSAILLDTATNGQWKRVLLCDIAKK